MGARLRKASKLMHLIGNSKYRQGLRSGVGAAIEHEGMIRNLEVDTLIDVGANIGQFSLLTKAIHPKADIYAFEPLSKMAAKYETLFRNDPRVTLHRMAAGEESGVFDINVSASPDSSSLLPITGRQSEVYPGTEAVSVEKVKVARLDDVIAAKDLHGKVLIKIDVQGFELSALKGMGDLLERADYVYAEASFLELYAGQPLADEIIQWLAGKSYRLAGVHNLSAAPTGQSVQADFLFVHDRQAGIPSPMLPE